MEWIIVLLLIVLIFKDEINELKQSLKGIPEKTAEEKLKEQEKEHRKEQFEKELNKIMDYNIDTAVESKKR